jgi:hypothetical protein
MKRWQRAFRGRFEYCVSFGQPGFAVTTAALDLAPGVAARERGVDGPPRESVLGLELVGDVPPHVPDHAAEVEDDGGGSPGRHSRGFC